MTAGHLQDIVPTLPWINVINGRLGVIIAHSEGDLVGFLIEVGRYLK